jgi:hypothetical protein
MSLPKTWHSISLGDCLETLPCKHKVTITFADGKTAQGTLSSMTLAKPPYFGALSAVDRAHIRESAARQEYRRERERATERERQPSSRFALSSRKTPIHTRHNHLNLK